MKSKRLPSVFNKDYFDDARFGTLIDHSIGMDDFFGQVFEEFLPAVTTIKYPPYNIRKDNEHTRTIEMAVAGYGEGDIDVTVDDSTLIIRGNKVSSIDEKKTSYVYKGLAGRSFERKFVLANEAEVTNAALKDGMLYITVATQPPEKVEVKRIPISTAAGEVPVDLKDS